MYKQWQKNFPMYLLLLYLFFTIFLFMISYDDSQVVNRKITFIYCCIWFTSLGLGYLPKWKNRVQERTFDYSKGMRIFVLFCAIMTIIISINNINAYYVDKEALLYYILRPGEAYEYVKFIRRHGPDRTYSIWESLLGVGLNFFSFTKYYVCIMLVACWKKFKVIDKVIVAVSILIYVAQTFLIGAMINIGTIAIGVLPILIAWAVIYNPHRKVAIATSALILLIGALWLFYFLGSRGVFTLQDGTKTNVFISGILGFAFYVSHGYQGLAYCFDLPQKFTFGYTLFYGIASKVLPVFGVSNLFENSFLYQNQMINGWSATQIWSTIFPWLASDLTFYLIPFVMFLFGYVMKLVWCESITNKNPFGFTLMGQFMLCCFMMPANNQLFLSFGNAMGFITISILYFWSTHKIIV